MQPEPSFWAFLEIVFTEHYLPLLGGSVVSVVLSSIPSIFNIPKGWATKALHRAWILLALICIPYAFFNAWKTEKSGRVSAEGQVETLKKDKERMGNDLETAQGKIRVLSMDPDQQALAAMKTELGALRAIAPRRLTRLQRTALISAITEDLPISASMALCANYIIHMTTTNTQESYRLGQDFLEVFREAGVDTRHSTITSSRPITAVRMEAAPGNPTAVLIDQFITTELHSKVLWDASPTYSLCQIGMLIGDKPSADVAD